MNDPDFQQHGGPHAAEHHANRPKGKKIHHSPFFWVAALFILPAMVIYVATNDLAFWPGSHAQQKPVPAVAP